jgi:predicted amino acid dehydrogenase
MAVAVIAVVGGWKSGSYSIPWDIQSSGGYPKSAFINCIAGSVLKENREKVDLRFCSLCVNT